MTDRHTPAAGGVGRRLSARLYRLIRATVKLVYPKTAVFGAENLPAEPCIFVGNHAQMNGPIACELYFPVERCTWCAGEMMHLREVPAYAYADFWSGKPGYIRWFFKLASYLIAPVSVCVFNNASCIGVYHDMRIMETFRRTVQKLEEGVSIVIFPEHAVPHNRIVCEFQDRFADVARMYYRKTGKPPAFVPFYVAPRLRAMYLGQPLRFDPAAPAAQERKRIAEAMMAGVTAMAEALPEHTVVPYLNIPKKQYPRNKSRVLFS